MSSKPYSNVSWKALIGELDADCECKFFASAPETQMRAVEQSLSVKLPEQLRGLLLESNGIEAGYLATRGLVWSLDNIEEQNREFRTDVQLKELYMPFDHLLFFGDDGGGDQFAYAVLNGAVRSHNVFRWEHESDGRPWFAGNLEQFLSRRLRGEE